MSTVNERLRKIDERIARIDRRLGFLEGRVYFKPVGAKDFTEISVIDFTDSGVTSRNFRTGEDVQARRYTVRVSKDWYLANSGVTGRYSIRRRKEEALIPCELEGLTCEDRDTTATLELRIAEGVSYV